LKNGIINAEVNKRKKNGKARDKMYSRKATDNKLKLLEKNLKIKFIVN